MKGDYFGLNVLDELKSLPQWVAYRLVWNEKKGKADKIPVNPHDGKGAKANDPSTWGTYDEAMNFAMRQGLIAGKSGGVGFEFAGGYAGIDLDHVIEADGTLKEFAQDIINMMNSYTEVSPSGTGVHILFKLTCPLSEIGDRNRDSKLGIEVYDKGRYFTVTGRAYGEQKPIAERTEELRLVYAKYLLSVREPEKPKPQVPTSKVSVPSVKSENVFVYSELSDYDLLDKMFSSRRGGEIRALFNGDISGYGSQSEADLALCSHLVYWTSGDFSRVDSLFRQSGLMRDKWDKSIKGQTYGAITISKALSSRVMEYVPPVRIEGSQKNVSADLRPESKIKVESNSSIGDDKVDQTEQNSERPEAVFKNIRTYIRGNDEGTSLLRQDLNVFQNYISRKTGYENIDAKMSLYPGLYVLGAISSLGKTTFVHQMADQLSQAGEHVLYFSLEQTSLELVTKGISRLTAQVDINTAVSSIDIRRGVNTAEVIKAQDTYAELSENEYVVECGFNTTIRTITDAVEQYIRSRGVSPIVIVDYLQIICPLDPRQSTKDTVDRHVRALKKLQTDNNLVVIVISSLNRQNYLTPIDFESFKESGGIEYTADVIWGLQLSVMNDDIFEKEKGLKQKRERVRNAKKATPREIDLVCLKNRYGVSSYTCRFRYYAQYDYFIPVDYSD